jgi:hypothetical protein
MDDHLVVVDLVALQNLDALNLVVDQPFLDRRDVDPVVAERHQVVAEQNQVFAEQNQVVAERHLVFVQDVVHLVFQKDYFLREVVVASHH